MLGRLRMSLEDCENAYLQLSERIFAPRRQRFNIFGQTKDFLQADGRFDAVILEEAIKDVLRAYKTEDALLKDEGGPCKVFVVAVRENNSEAAVLRSYKSSSMSNVLYNECKIWEACRATSAATTFFAPVRIGKYGQRFVDGAMRYNNPVQLVHREAESLWPSRDLFILSIGTGSAPGKSFRGNLKSVVDGLKNIVTETEKTANDFYHGHRYMVQEDLLFRFNVFHGLGHIGLEENKEISAIADATEAYLDQGETGKKLEACIGRLRATITDEIPYTEFEVMQSESRGRMSESFDGQYNGTPKFTKTGRLQQLETGKAHTLCILRHRNSSELHGLDVMRVDDARQLLGVIGQIPYAYIGYTSLDFDQGNEEDLRILHQFAEAATRKLRLPAYWLPCSCMGDVENMERAVWTLCDVTNAAESLAVIVKSDRGNSTSVNLERKLVQWCSRLWSSQELLLCPRGRPIDIYDVSSAPLTTVALELSRRSLVDAAYPTANEPLQRLVDHYEGIYTLGRLDFLCLLLAYLTGGKTAAFLRGDISYVLMGFLPFRPVPDKTDSGFQALARVLLANDVDNFLERYISICPKSRRQYYTITDDFWGINLRDIRPTCQVSGVTSDFDALIVDGALGAKAIPADARGSTPSSYTSDERPRFICFHGDISATDSSSYYLPGPLRILNNGNTTTLPRPFSPDNFTLVDTLTMTAIPFQASAQPSMVLLTGMEGNMYRGLLCSYYQDKRTLFRESVVKLNSRVAEKMTRLERVQLSLFRPGRLESS
ncbi:acyl transferase/acyl hydrolase/lysophospholipase [Truncatella angustata]|uniref:Acyl transferase/acyl hydrolase/lysophospholipase n=1 Tax=Truncatella angustata TaxID=152316 RepID=A0A9P8UIX3_9PEZI|nr:acyl transferase/acyl hydrolase/lysophospholipase [Truncatella angustata]KAH6653065.1 acyl transferase/acyl hydrolase/lysophospholipase [Truncatella angustata]